MNKIITHVGSVTCMIFTGNFQKDPQDITLLETVLKVKPETTVSNTRYISSGFGRITREKEINMPKMFIIFKQKIPKV